MADPDNAPLVAALRRQLEAGGAAVELIETHMSRVLLAGDRAWKIKKPVDLGVADFGSLERRHHFCCEELRLNHRHAPALYRRVVPVTGSPAAPRLGGDGPAIEWALEMRRLPPRALLSECLADGRLEPAHIDLLAARVAAGHRSAPAAASDGPWSTPGHAISPIADRLSSLAALGEDVTDLDAWLATEGGRLAPLMARRAADGRVRECHGDMHLANVALLDGSPTPFDAIEFDPALRWIDVQCDIAFTTMDLLAHGRDRLAWHFVDAWLTASGDFDGMALARLYLTYRALVRAWVCLLRPSTPPAPRATDYLRLARRLARQPQHPRLLVTHGLSGSGKSHLTQGLLEETGAVRLRSDVERKRLFGLGALESSAGRGRGDIYGRAANERTYGRLEDLARGLLRCGWPVIVDAACLRRAERDRFVALARDLAVPCTLLECRAAPDVLRERVRHRARHGGDASEADAAVLESQFGHDEPLAPDEAACAIVCDAGSPPDAAAIAARWGPTRP